MKAEDVGANRSQTIHAHVPFGSSSRQPHGVGLLWLADLSSAMASHWILLNRGGTQIEWGLQAVTEHFSSELLGLVQCV